jgi:hypothetical protein
MYISSLRGVLYFLLFINDFSRYIHVYFLYKKSEALSYFIQYKNLVENEISQKILFLHSNNGGKFTSQNFNKLCVDYGI